MARPWMDFTRVDASGNVDAHAAYLARMATLDQERRRQSVEKLGLRTGSTLLDAGCGLGELAIELAPRVAPGGRIVGIDSSREMIERARLAGLAVDAAVEFDVGSVTAVPFADDTFDAARSERVFQHLTADEREQAAAELIRVVKPRGIVQILDPNHAQWAVTAEDREFAHLLTDFVTRRGRTPESGLLNGALMHAAGAVDVETEVRPFVLASVADWYAVLALDGAIEALIADGAITADRATAFFEDLASLEHDGVFLAVGVRYDTTGRVAG